MIDVSCLPFRDELIARSCKRTQPRRPDQRRPAMTDREVEAISDFLRHFGSFGCRQICVRRTEPKPRTPEDVGHFVLETLATWRAEGLDAERLYRRPTCRRCRTYRCGRGDDVELRLREVHLRGDGAPSSP